MEEEAVEVAVWVAADVAVWVVADAVVAVDVVAGEAAGRAFRSYPATVTPLYHGRLINTP